jgi:hypothetical protein
MRNSWMNFSAVLCVISCIAGCQYDPDSSLYVTTPPTESEVVGTYQFTTQHVNSSEKVAGSPTILLFADHRCEITDFPEWEELGMVWKLVGKHSCVGTWKVDDAGSLDNGWGKLKTIVGVSFKISPVVPTAKMTLEHSRRGLLFGYGDPDQGESMKFAKVK